MEGVGISEDSPVMGVQTHDRDTFEEVLEVVLDYVKDNITRRRAVNGWPKKGNGGTMEPIVAIKKEIAFVVASLDKIDRSPTIPGLDPSSDDAEFIEELSERVEASCLDIAALALWELFRLRGWDSFPTEAEWEAMMKNEQMNLFGQGQEEAKAEEEAHAQAEEAGIK